jgi:glycosyltransferase involved in cell wall biosynthesis
MIKLSIITINYNDAEGLRKTLASVASQTYADIEHIIVDGGSTDGSVEIIREYADEQAIRLQGYEAIRPEKNGKADDTLPNRPIAQSPHRHEIRWICEPDKGIYNAMNKGIEVALGKRVINDDHTSSPIANCQLPIADTEYIQIVNSGDILAAPDVTERMMAALASQCAEIKGDSLKIKGEENSEAEINAYNLSSINYKLNTPIFYGNMTKVNAAGEIVGKSGYTEYSLRQFYSSTLNHDCAYIRRDLFEEYGLYDENLKIVSDWKWYLQAIGLGKVKPEHVDIDVTIFDDGGISETNLALRNKERRQVLEELLPPAVLWDYDTHAFEMEQMNRLRRWKMYGLVYLLERTLFKLEKWGVLRRG